MPILDSQKAELFSLVNGASFEAREFDFTDTKVGATLTHRASGFYFVIGLEAGGYVVRYSPASDRIEAGYGTSTWERIVPPKVTEWLGYLRRELGATNPWAQLAVERETGSVDLEGGNNTPFAPAELTEVRGRLEEAREYARTLDLGPEQLAAVESRLIYLEGAAERGMGRIDWRNAFVGVMMTLVVEAIVPPETVRTLLALTLGVLGHLFGFGPPELLA